MSTLLLFGGMFLLMYLLIIRPQSKRAKEHKALVTSITKGDEVLTSGGVLGRVTRVSDDYLAIEVSDGVELKVQKVAIATALPKGTLAKI
jgi:preprotein translocase subunit YajC